MDVRAITAPDAGARLGESRARVLDLLRVAGGPLGVRDVADRAGLHANTARFHLDGLVDAGLATREPQPRETPGRPSVAYRATDWDRPMGQRRYRLLAEMLTSMIAGMVPQPQAAATEAGREWGRYLTEQPPPYRGPAAEQAVAKLASALEELGFAPEVVAESQGYRLRLRQCPFREVAQQHQDVVCAMHLGLLQGVLEQIRAPVTADDLQPFAEPGVCVAQLSVRNAQLTKPVPGQGDDSADPAEGAEQAASSESQGGEAACWAHLVCPECGATTSEGHRQGCVLATPCQDITG
jgi:predicted ArsR family transcriptional regulator